MSKKKNHHKLVRVNPNIYPFGINSSGTVNVAQEGLSVIVVRNGFLVIPKDEYSSGYGRGSSKATPVGALFCRTPDEVAEEIKRVLLMSRLGVK